MARDKAGVEAEEQRRAEQLAWTKQNGSEQSIAEEQRRYDEFLRRNPATRW